MTTDDRLDAATRAMCDAIEAAEAWYCVVCGAKTGTPGATCKAVDCISAWVLGHMP